MESINGGGGVSSQSGCDLFVLFEVYTRLKAGTGLGTDGWVHQTVQKQLNLHCIAKSLGKPTTSTQICSFVQGMV